MKRSDVINNANISIFLPPYLDFTFKTMRKPPEVIVEDMLFAAGTLMFDVKVADPDETIIGVSGDKVVVQLYTQRGEFVKTVRVLKDLEDWQILAKLLDKKCHKNCKLIDGSICEYIEVYKRSFGNLPIKYEKRKVPVECLAMGRFNSFIPEENISEDNI